jgi:competence protein ComEC
VLKWILHARLPRTVLVCAGCLALFGGMWLAKFALLGEARWLWLLAPAAVLVFRRRSLLALLLVVVLGCGLGWWRGTAMLEAMAPYQRVTRQQVLLTARAAEDGVYGKQYQLTFTVDQVRLLAPEAAELPGSLIISGFGAAAVYRGDTVQVAGKLYPSRGNSVGRISFGEITVLARGGSWIDEFRRRFAAGMQNSLPEPAASFGMGLLIGQRNTLPPEISETLLTVGLTHIIAVSGYNLTIMVNAVRRLLANRSKFQMAAACMALVGTFLLITGNSPSIVRASIISMLSLCAWYYGRAIPPVTLLLTAGAISVWANPLYIWGNVSWYLSFLAFFGVIVVAPLVMRRLYPGEKQPGLLMQITIESICAEMTTLPYVLFIFGQMSLTNLPANVLVATFVPLAMLLGVFAGVAGMFLPALAGWAAWPAKLVLTYMLDMAYLLSRVPHSFIEGIGFSAAYMVVSYAIVGVVMLGLRRRPKYAIITGKKKE